MFNAFRRIRGRILSTYLILIIISMIVLGLALIWPLQNYFLSNFKNNMVDRANLVSQLVKKNLLNGNYNIVDEQAKGTGEKIDTRITIILPNGRVVADSEHNPFHMENHSKRPEIEKALSGNIGTQSRYSTTLDTDMMYVAIPMFLEEKIIAVTRLSMPLTEIEKIIFRLRSILVTGILIAVLISILLSIKLTKGLTEPIEAINKDTSKIAQGDLNVKVYSLTKDELGELGNSINYMTSILKEKINELSQENSRLENILNTMVSGVIVLDLVGLVRIINPTAEEFFGIIGSTCVEKHNMEVIRHTGLNEQIKKSIKKEKIIDYEFSISYPEEKILQCYIAPVYRDNNMISGTTIVFHDITNLRKLERMRADFVANASHELRTPLTAIKGYAETLLDGALDNKDISKNFINIIDNEADRLILLVEELLALSRAEGSLQEQKFQSVKIDTMIKTVSEELKQQFEKKEINFKLELQERLPNVKANLNQVKQVIVNLLDNALKYTPQKGSIFVKAYVQEDFVKVDVEDTGIGIPEKDISRVFERFYRVDKARSRQMGGFGLGLSIVKHIVESSGGEIGVESKVNKGSIFWFTLPKES